MCRIEPVDAAALAERVVDQHTATGAEPGGVAADLADVVVAGHGLDAGRVLVDRRLGPQTGEHVVVVGSQEEARRARVDVELVERSGAIGGKVLHLHELLETFDAVLPADAARLVAAEGPDEIGAVLVDADRPGADPPGDVEAVRLVAGPDGTGEPEVGVVRDPDRVAVVRVRDHDDHRAEDLLTGDAHRVVTGQDRRPNPPAAVDALGHPGATGDHGAPSSIPMSM